MRSHFSIPGRCRARASAIARVSASQFPWLRATLLTSSSNFKFASPFNFQFLLTVFPILVALTLAAPATNADEMLAFSACQTGMSFKEADGKEIDSLAAIGRKQGAQAVLATLW